MKTFIFASTVLTMTTWVCYANTMQDSIIPESTASLVACQEWADSHQGTALYAHANSRCAALKNCMDNESTGKLQLRACIAEVESQFYNALNLVQPSSQSQTSLGRAHQLDKDAVTNAANSDYDLLGGDAKGFRNANQGSN